MARTNQIRDPILVSRQQNHKICVETVPNLRRLGHELIASGQQEADILAPIGPPHWRQLFAGADPRDRERIDRIALARTMGPDPLPMAQMRRHVSDIEASSGEGAGCSGAITTAAFQADPFGTGLTDPLHERLMSTGVVGEGPLSHRHPERVHRTRRQCRLVGVDPNRRHLPAPSLTEYDGRGPAGQVCVESKPRSYQAMAGPLVFAAGALELQAKAKAGPHQVSHLPLGRTFAEKASTTLRTHQDDIGQASTCAGNLRGDRIRSGWPRFRRCGARLAEISGAIGTV